MRACESQYMRNNPEQYIINSRAREAANTNTGQSKASPWAWPIIITVAFAIAYALVTLSR